MRMEAHRNYLQSLPYYTLYHQYNGRPPLNPQQLANIHSQIARANVILQQGVDQDWRTSCLRYPEILDYYLGLVTTIASDSGELRAVFPTEKTVDSPRFTAVEVTEHPDDSHFQV